MTKNRYGGPRPRSGRKTELQGQPTKRVQVTLDARTLELLAVVGGGNVSKGIRHSARLAYEQYQREP
jgi:hypothetical protein